MGALAASRAVSRVVPESPALDWPLVAVAALGLVGVTTLAAWLPASRAARMDPAVTLRSE